MLKKNGSKSGFQDLMDFCSAIDEVHPGFLHVLDPSVAKGLEHRWNRAGVKTEARARRFFSMKSKAMQWATAKQHKILLDRYKQALDNAYVAQLAASAAEAAAYQCALQIQIQVSEMDWLGEMIDESV